MTEVERQAGTGDGSDQGEGAGLPIGRVDKASALPAYAQLADHLRRALAQEVYSPGKRLPSESLLAKGFGVSPMTARQAVSVLVEEGLLRRVHGSGTFVRRIQVARAQFTLGAMYEAFHDRENIEVKILKAAVERAQGRIASKLEASPGERLVVVERLIRHRGAPFAFQAAYARFDPETPILEKMLDTSVLTEFIFEESHPGFKKGVLKLKADLPDEKIRLLLGLDGPALRLEHLFYDFNDRAAAFGWFILGSDRMGLVSRVGVWDE